MAIHIHDHTSTAQLSCYCLSECPSILITNVICNIELKIIVCKTSTWIKSQFIAFSVILYVYFTFTHVMQFLLHNHYANHMVMVGCCCVCKKYASWLVHDLW